MAKVWQRADIEGTDDNQAASRQTVDMSDYPIPGVCWLMDREAQELFHERARAALGISGGDFLRRWDAGDYDHLIDDPEHPEILRLAMMESFGR